MLNPMQKRTILEREAARNLRKARIAELKYEETDSPHSLAAMETRRFLAEVCHREAAMYKSVNDYEFILISAMRYALGRQSMAPGIVMDFIRDNLTYLSAGAIRNMIRDLEEAKSESGKDGCRPYAMGDQQVDRPRWLSFLSALRLELEKRRKEGAAV